MRGEELKGSGKNMEMLITINITFSFINEELCDKNFSKCLRGWQHWLLWFITEHLRSLSLSPHIP